MCAINGFTGPSNETFINLMNAATVHRGPDGTSSYFGDGITLGHNRLAIIDPNKRSDQPMTDVSGRYTIVFNGEIYNFKDLKKALSYPFQTESDTEVILAGYREKGVDFFSKLNGIFAFAIWDSKEQSLVLARDSVGVKPLYYTVHNKQLIFSSEIPGLLVHNIPRKFSLESLNVYLRLLYVPGPHTMIQDVLQLPPGHYIKTEKGSLTLSNFFLGSREKYPVSIPFKQAVSHTREKIIHAVERQLLSDKPLGFFLSGGLDSTIVLAAAAHTTKNLNTFSIEFTDLGDPKAPEKFNADAMLAARTARLYDTKHHRVVLPMNATGDLLEKAVRHVGTPISTATEISQLMLSAVAKRDVDVVLTGDGGDELYGGYERYRFGLIADAIDGIPFARQALMHLPHMQKFADAPNAERIARFMFVKENVLQPLLTEKFAHFDAYRPVNKTLSRFDSSVPFTQRMIWHDRDSWLVDHSLGRTDSMSMAYGLEARVPLLDHELVAFVESLPLSYKTTLGTTKRILREAFANEIAHLGSQPKRGWFSPGTKWLRRGPVHGIARDAFSANYLESTQDLFQWDVIQKLFEDHCHCKQNNTTVLWAIMTFQLWAKTFKMEPV